MGTTAGAAPAEAAAEAAATMSAGVHGPVLRQFAFGELESGLWGMGWVPPEAPGAGVLGFAGSAQTERLLLEGQLADQTWRGLIGISELVLEAVGEPVWAQDGLPETGFDQLCRVSGKLMRGDASNALSCLGWRSVRPGSPDLRRVESLRQVAGWFDPGEGFALLALRPRDAKGHEGEDVEAALFDAQTPRRVSDPRLSTTYDRDGTPVRAGVELWVQVDEQAEHQYPRRALGDALQPPVPWTMGEMALHSLPFRWHTGAQQGAGIYVLGTCPASRR